MKPFSPILFTTCHQWSCSQFHQHFTSSFCANILSQKYYKAELYLEKNCPKFFRTKKLSIKCWWNWHLGVVQDGVLLTLDEGEVAWLDGRERVDRNDEFYTLQLMTSTTLYQSARQLLIVLGVIQQYVRLFWPIFDPPSTREEILFSFSKVKAFSRL